MPNQPRVFISYSRGDGLGFARELRAWLEEKKIPLFQDLISLVGGEDFLEQIKKAIEQVEFLLLVMTPNAVKSEAVKKEWRHARQSGVCVYPVIPPKVKVAFEGLPHWMSSVDWYDLNYEEQWTKLLNDLSRSCKTPRVPSIAEELPENFVPRPAEFEALVNLLRDPEREEPVAMTAALRGAGGYGKTTLARALCHDERVQEAFDDGILWVTLTENPGDLKGKVLDLIEVLSGARPGFGNLEAAGTRLAELLADRDILLVVDDVWNSADLAPFLRGGKRCARLVTTRNRDTLPANARAIDVDAMRQDEAVKLLGAGLPAGEEHGLRALATRLGDWPVLLNLVNGVLRYHVIDSHQPLADALKYVNADLDENGLTAFDASDPGQRDQAVGSTVAVSLARLKPEERDRYRELAIFPEDVDIPLSTIERLWLRTSRLSQLSTEKLCERLHRLSLLLRYDLATRTIRLHDVMRAYLARELAKQRDSKTVHAMLVDAWDDPHHLPDAYAWRWYAYHLKQAGREEELRERLLDYTWIEAKLAATDVTALLSDYETASANPKLGLSTKDGVLPGEPIQVPPWRRVNPEPAALSPSPDPRPRATAPLSLLEGTLRLSAHVLAQDKDQLPCQLLGRLLWNREPQIRDLLSRAAQFRSAPWLKPLRASLRPPGGPLVRTLAGHSGGVRAVAVTPDGKQAVSASWDHTLKVWDLATGKELRTLAGHSDAVTAVAVFKSQEGDGKQAVSASDDQTLKVWDLASGKCLATFTADAAMTACAVARDGVTVVAGDQSGAVHFLELEGVQKKDLR